VIQKGAARLELGQKFGKKWILLEQFNIAIIFYIFFSDKLQKKGKKALVSFEHMFWLVLSIFHLCDNLSKGGLKTEINRSWFFIGRCELDFGRILTFGLWLHIYVLEVYIEFD